MSRHHTGSRSTHARARLHVLATMEQSLCVPTLVAAVRESRGLNQPSRCPGLRQRCDAVRCGAELSEATRKSVFVEVISIKEFKSHSCCDDFSFGCDNNERRRWAQPNVARLFSLTNHKLPLTTSLGLDAPAFSLPVEPDEWGSPPPQNEQHLKWASTGKLRWAANEGNVSLRDNVARSISFAWFPLLVRKC